MKVSDLVQAIGCNLITKNHADSEIQNAYTSDLLSDVMANAIEGSIFITMQSHINSVAVASQLDFPALLICNGRTVTDDMIAAAEKDGIAILTTNDNQFISSFKVHKVLFGNS